MAKTVFKDKDEFHKSSGEVIITKEQTIDRYDTKTSPKGEQGRVMTQHVHEEEQQPPAVWDSSIGLLPDVSTLQLDQNAVQTKKAESHANLIKMIQQNKKANRTGRNGSTVSLSGTLS